MPPKSLHKLCFQFLLGQLLDPGEMKNKGYAKFWEMCEWRIVAFGDLENAIEVSKFSDHN